MSYSSSDSQSRILHSLQVWLFGFLPSTQSTLPHLPQRIDVRIGGSSVVSTLNITLPASGILEASGSQSATETGSTSISSSMLRPNKSNPAPARANGAAVASTNSEVFEVRAIPPPRMRHAQAARTVLIFLLPGRIAMMLRVRYGASIWPNRRSK